MSHQTTPGLLPPARTPGGIPNPGSPWEVIPSASSLQHLLFKALPHGPIMPYAGGREPSKPISVWTQRARLVHLMQGEMVTSCMPLSSVWQLRTTVAFL